MVLLSGQQLEFSCKDFVRGKPELLEKIADRYLAKMEDTPFWVVTQRVKNATTREEYDLAFKERREIIDRKSKKRKAIMAKRVVTSSPTEGIEDQVKHLGI